MKVLVTGSSGFIGKNLCSSLSLHDSIELLKLTRDHSPEELTQLVLKADFIYHIAGINRPKNDHEFTEGNTDLTKSIVETLRAADKKTPVLITSSIQAELDNPYGKSKLAAENAVLQLREQTGAQVYIYRLPGVFGKWSKPNYNSVVATWCYNIAHDLPIEVSDPNHTLKLVYIDDVVDSFVAHLEASKAETNPYHEVTPTFEVSLGDLSDRIRFIHNIRSDLVVPDLSDKLNKCLYATYISYLDTDNFSYDLTKNSDTRGWLAEFVKSKQFGQIFISKTKPGISRGEHWHHTKIEKFLVVEGQAEIIFRNKIHAQDIIRYTVNGDDATVLDIPTGYVHAIKNIGESDLITIFWANEILDKNKPDTFFEKVEE
ncbi:MAG: NAD-dependent epimerase/dehydratase family protein [Candidatus Saccharimonas sp.]